MRPLKISHYTVTTALGAGCDANFEKLLSGESGLTACDFPDTRYLDTWIGKVSLLDSFVFPSRWQEFECRNNALSMLALQQDNFYNSAEKVIAQYGAARVGLFMGTSTSGIHQTEQAYLARENDEALLPEWFNYQTTHNVYAVTEFVRRYLGLEGLTSVISTACSSSAKVFASAARAIQQGYCDAALVGGTDTLCLTTLYGFNSLQLLSSQPCKPSDVNRNGISIGEASGFAILERDNPDARLALLGYGESSDAYHMSQPHPEGKGASLAMEAALQRAGLLKQKIGYINLHGTGTRANDLAEANAISGSLSNTIPCSSTKGWTGHTLGAAGIVEAVISLLAIQNNFLPGSLNTEQIDPLIPIRIQMQSVHKQLNCVLSNSFGFGGNNCSLVFGKAVQA
jgi:3-oxoacyl-[acyl-carrier-protein] synthase-1